MKTASLLYTYDLVLKRLQDILPKNGFTVLSINPGDGTIKKGLFGKHKTVDLKVENIKPGITDITLYVNSNKATYSKARTDDEHVEERLIDLINMYF